jgi:chromosome segregation ATPase
MGASDTAQAMELVRALRDQLRQMTARLSQVERQGAASGDRAAAMRVEAATLRRDIYEAKKHIDRLQRHYLDGNELTRSLANGHRPGQ